MGAPSAAGCRASDPLLILSHSCKSIQNNQSPASSILCMYKDFILSEFLQYYAMIYIIHYHVYQEIKELCIHIVNLFTIFSLYV